MAQRRFEDDELTISLSATNVRRKPPARAAADRDDPADATGRSPANNQQQPIDSMNMPGSPSPLVREKVKTEQRIGAYKIIKTLGEGSFGKVKLAVHHSTGQQVALKIIARKKLISRDMAGRVEREIEYLQLLRHPHIIKLYTVIKTPTEIIMVLEFAGGELFDYIVQNGRLKETEARRFFQQMICAVEYCHRHKIVHRDLKPENLLLDDQLNVKIADFGLSNIMTDGNFLKTSCGSPNYAAPEVIGGKLYAGPEVDVWSCGVILFVLVAGRLPFDDEHIPSLFARIAKGQYTIPTWFPPGPANLIRKMLVVNPVQRATIEEIRQDPWFMTDLPSYLQPPVEEFYNTGVDPNKAIQKSDIAPGAPAKVQEKLHNEVTDKISKTMGYGKRDVEEALASEEPSAIKDAYMIVRENKMMEANSKSLGEPTTATTAGGKVAPMANPAAEAADATSAAELDAGSSPMLSMSSARSNISTMVSPRPYASKVGVLPSSLPAYHKAFMEREKAGIDDLPPMQDMPDDGNRTRTDADKEETARRLKRNSQLRLDEMARRPQSLTPVNPPKKLKPVRWQFGIRSRNAPWEALLCIHKALHKLGAKYLPDEDYEKVHGADGEALSSVDGSFVDDYNGAPLQRYGGSTNSLDPERRYKLPADPWKIRVRWETNARYKNPEAPETYEVKHPGGETENFVAMHMDIQIYEMEAGQGSYLVDFKCSGYETLDHRLLDEKEVTSPFPFLDMAARLIMQLAEAD